MISIIIPVYNAEKYIERCLNSILCQDFKNYEIIVINDGSSDKTESIVKNYESLNQNLKLITKKNEGSASARNVGLNNANGDYIVFVDADDYIHVDYLNIMYEVMQKNNVDIVECDFNMVKNNDKYDNKYIVNYDENIKIVTNIEKLEEFCSRENYLKTAVLWNKLYKKNLFNNVRFVENKGIDDEFIIHKIIYNAKSIAIINMKLYYYCLSENSQMRSKASIKRIDNTEAIENQINFFHEKKLFDLKEKLYYRYYKSIISNYIYVKKYFSNEKEIVLKLKNKRKKMYEAILSKNISIKDKIYLVCYRVSPKIFNIIHKIICKENKISQIR